METWKGETSISGKTLRSSTEYMFTESVLYLASVFLTHICLYVRPVGDYSLEWEMLVNYSNLRRSMLFP